jgi:hypothetical protein
MSDNGANPYAEASQQPAGLEATTINRSWLTKMIIFTVVLAGFGSWGLYDAIYLYPKRGVAAAEYLEMVYLQQSEKAGKLSLASVPSEPQAALDRIRAMPPASKSEVDKAQEAWLYNLSLVNRLSPEYTAIANPSARLKERTDQFNNREKPEPLAAYDIPLQWAFCAVGYIGALAVLSNIFLSSRKVYRYDPQSLTLHLPTGRTIEWSQLAEVDKRKWHKYFCALVPSDGSPTVELDLLKYQNLEGWVLEMEAKRFPPEVQTEQLAEQQPA